MYTKYQLVILSCNHHQRIMTTKPLLVYNKVAPFRYQIVAVVLQLHVHMYMQHTYQSTTACVVQCCYTGSSLSISLSVLLLVCINVSEYWQLVQPENIYLQKIKTIDKDYLQKTINMDYPQTNSGSTSVQFCLWLGVFTRFQSPYVYGIFNHFCAMLLFS